MKNMHFFTQVLVAEKNYVFYKLLKRLEGVKEFRLQIKKVQAYAPLDNAQLILELNKTIKKNILKIITLILIF